MVTMHKPRRFTARSVSSGDILAALIRTVDSQSSDLDLIACELLIEIRAECEREALVNRR